jgi:hypothetical protein
MKTLDFRIWFEQLSLHAKSCDVFLSPSTNSVLMHRVRCFLSKLSLYRSQSLQGQETLGLDLSNL